MTDENIIIIRNEDKTIALEAFDRLMSDTTNYLNEQAAATPGKYKRCNGGDMEEVVADAMRVMCAGTPFCGKEVELVSGQCFPDIIAHKYYGVEVKTTKDNHWTSTGSSIAENTRNKDVENIYMLFGKLGGTLPQFRCKPYDQCLYDVSVTHSPRYLIDMNLQEQRKPTIFQKMALPYDDFRLLDDPIRKIRSYYREKALAEGRKEMPWWLSSDNETDVAGMNVSLWVENKSRENIKRNNTLRAQMFILFPEVLKSDFDNAALWLCTRHSIVNSHIRDTFTAGGQCLELGGDKLPFPLPRVIGRLLDSSQDIVELLTHSSDFDYDLREFRPDLCGADRLHVWLSKIDGEVDRLKYKMDKVSATIGDRGGIPIVDWILANQKVTAYSNDKNK